MIIVLYAVTALLYGGLSLAAWRAYRRQPAFDAVFANGVPPIKSASLAAERGGVSLPASRIALLLALIAHGILLHATIFPSDSMVFGFAFALSAMLWLGAGIYLIESFFFPLEGMGLLVLPLACLASLTPAMFRGVRVLSYAADPLFKLHFLIANVAYGLLAIAALHAALMLLAERRLHAARRGGKRPAAKSPGGAVVSGRALGAESEAGHWLTEWLETLPPLLTMEKLLFRLISAGFVLLTLTLLTGILFSEQLLDRLVSFNHKTVFAVLSWLMFGGLVVGRKFYGWRGRTALRLVLMAFLALVLAYIGSRFVLEVLLHRQVI